MTLLIWIAEAAARFSLLVALTALALRVLRVRRAETQLQVWTLVLVAALALPFVPPQWVIPVDITAAAPIADLRLPMPIVDSQIPDSTSSIPDFRFQIIDNPWPSGLYAAIALVLLSRLLVGAIWAARLRQSARPVEGHAFSESDRIQVPVTVGLFRPMVLVPAAWRTWPADTLAAVLAHEADHAGRRDGLRLTLALLHRAVHWMNPLSWWLARHIATLSERASDDAALTKGVAPARYAEVLLGFAALVATHHRRVSWVVPMARFGAPDTERRLLRILSWKGRAPMTRSRLLILGLVLVAGSAAVYTATISSLSVLDPNERPMTVFAEQVFYPEGSPQDIKEPIALTRVDPKYTADGLRAGIQGIVELEVEVGPLGQVVSAKVTKSLDTVFGLDAAALEAVRRWHFVPRTVNGKAVPSTVAVQMEFRTHRRDDAPLRVEPAQPSTASQAPVVMRRVDPKYTPEAMRARIQGTVRIEAVVDTRGRVTNARIIESLDSALGLDANALSAAMQWQYEPARSEGQPVPATVVIEMEFRLH